MPEEIEPKPEEIVEEQPKVGFLDKLKIHKFKILGGVLGILVFAGAVFGAYKLGQRQIQFSQPSPTPEVVVTPTPDLTANWKTYRSKDLNFELKYPSHYTPKENISEANQGTVSFYVDGLCNQNYLSPYVNYNNQISIREKLVSSEPIEVNFIQTNLNINELPNNDHCLVIGKAEIGDRLRASVSFKSDGDDWQIGAIVRADNLDSDLDLFSLMLSTFRFLGEGWETHTNSSYKFSFKYPFGWKFEESDSGYPSKILEGETIKALTFRSSSWVLEHPEGYQLMVLPEGEFDHGLEGYIKKGDVIVGGKSVERWDREENEGDYKFYSVIFLKDYHDFRIEFLSTEGTQQSKELFENILSTFRFLE